MAVIKGGNPKPLPNDDAKDCPTGWCDDFNGQFSRPANWGDPKAEPRTSPKLGNGGRK